jgi:hypothetical protein
LLVASHKHITYVNTCVSTNWYLRSAEEAHIFSFEKTEEKNSLSHFERFCCIGHIFCSHFL